MKPARPETVLITGASSGIGLELARCFAADQSRLVLVARNTAALEALAAELRRSHPIDIEIVTADLTRAEAPAEIFERLGRAGVEVDVLVNNAGFGLHGPFAELPRRRQLEMVQVNVAALVDLTALFLPGMRQRQQGGILNVGSVAGFLPGPNMAVYYATKAFVQSFTEAVREEVAGTGITVSVLCPGPTETNFSRIARLHRTREFQASKMSARQVAVAGHRAFRQGKCISVPGIQNQLLTFAPRIFPRSTVRKISGHYNRLNQ